MTDVKDVKDQVAAAIVQARSDLEQALADLDRLPAFDPGTVAFAAHALSNFLTVTGCTADLLLAALADHPDSRIRDWLQGIQQATNMMSHITTDLMTNASITSVPSLKFERVDLPLMIQRACAFYQRKAALKQLRISWEIQAHQPYARADRVAVAAVIDNLLSNAVKYSPHEKQIKVTVRTEPGALVCSVQDEGPGLSDEDQSKLFQKGVCLSSRPTGGELTTGYGLAVAKELIGPLGGTIWCESQLGHGAKFSFRLPEYPE